MLANSVSRNVNDVFAEEKKAEMKLGDSEVVFSPSLDSKVLGLECIVQPEKTTVSGYKQDWRKYLG